MGVKEAKFVAIKSCTKKESGKAFDALGEHFGLW